MTTTGNENATASTTTSLILVFMFACSSLPAARRRAYHDLFFNIHHTARQKQAMKLLFFESAEKIFEAGCADDAILRACAAAASNAGAWSSRRVLARDLA